MPNSKPLLLSFDDYEAPAQRLAEYTGFDIDMVKRHRFPDGETQIRLPTTLPSRVIFCRSLDNPNEKLVELLIAADAARQNGAKQVYLVAPYLCYMRQDKAFHPGEAISQRSVGRFLGDTFDGVITVDPHLHRIASLSEIMSCPVAISLSAMPVIAEYINQHFTAPFLIGPDEESEQWVSQVANITASPYRICSKQRLGDTQVQVSLPSFEAANAEILIIDDMASTAHTLVETVTQVKEFLPKSISVLVTHGLFVGNAVELLKQVGVTRIISSDSVLHASNDMKLAGLLGDCLQDLL